MGLVIYMSLLSAQINSFIFMGLDIVEATSGMGMHLKDIPPNILERQMKVCQTPVLILNSPI